MANQAQKALTNTIAEASRLGGSSAPLQSTIFVATDRQGTRPLDPNVDRSDRVLQLLSTAKMFAAALGGIINDTVVAAAAARPIARNQSQYLLYVYAKPTAFGVAGQTVSFSLNGAVYTIRADNTNLDELEIVVRPGQTLLVTGAVANTAITVCLVALNPDILNDYAR